MLIVVPKDQDPAIAVIGRRTARNVHVGTAHRVTTDRVVISHDVRGKVAGPVTGPRRRVPEANDLRIAKSGRVVKMVHKKKSRVLSGPVVRAKVAAQHG